MTKSDFLTPIRAQSSAQSPIRATSQSCTQPARSALRSLVGLVCFRLFVYFGSLSLFWFCLFIIWLHFVYFGSFSFYLAFFPFPFTSLPALPLSLQVPFIPRPVPTPRPAAPPRSAPGRCSGEVPPGGALPTGARGAVRCSAVQVRCVCAAAPRGRTDGQTLREGTEPRVVGLSPALGAGLRAEPRGEWAGCRTPCYCWEEAPRAGGCPVNRCQVRLQRGRVTFTGLGGSGGGLGNGREVRGRRQRSL